MTAMASHRLRSGSTVRAPCALAVSTAVDMVVPFQGTARPHGHTDGTDGAGWPAGGEAPTRRRSTGPVPARPGLFLRRVPLLRVVPQYRHQNVVDQMG